MPSEHPSWPAPAGPPPLPGPVPPAGGNPCVISVGGGRGGVGKSLLTINLGVYLAQLGRKVIVADCDPAGADLHTVLGLDVAPTPAIDAQGDEIVDPIATPVPGLSLLPAAYEPNVASLFRTGKKARWLSRLRTLAADYVLLDLGSGMMHAALDLFLLSDLGVCVTIPEPPAIEATYRFLRVLFLRRLRRTLLKERFKLRLIERAMRDLPPLPTPLEIVAAIRRFDEAIAKLAAIELSKMRPHLVVCQTRVRTDVELGPSMRAMAARYLGVDLDYLGHVEHDDAVWLTVRRRRPLLIDSPTSKSARNLERIARRVLGLVTTRDARPAEPLPIIEERDMTLYDTLGVSRGASDEDVRRAYKRRRELFSKGSLPLTSLLPEDALAREQARIEEAHDTLLDPVRRRAYDLSAFADSATDSDPVRPGASDAVVAELEMLQAELAREITPETQFTGALLRKVREAQGVDLSEISKRTKIATSHLRAIEDEAFAELPAVVYTRGFVQELAKCLKLDPAQVAKTYLSRMRDALVASGRPVV